MVFLDIVVCSVLYKVVTVVKCGKEYLIEDISELDCKIEVDVWKTVVSIDGEDIEVVIDDISLVALVDIFTGTSDIFSGVVIDVVIIVEISDVVTAVDMSCKEVDGVCKSDDGVTDDTWDVDGFMDEGFKDDTKNEEVLEDAKDEMLIDDAKDDGFSEDTIDVTMEKVLRGDE